MFSKQKYNGFIVSASLFTYLIFLPRTATIRKNKKGADFKKQAYENAYQIAYEIGRGIENRHLTIPPSALYLKQEAHSRAAY